MVCHWNTVVTWTLDNKGQRCSVGELQEEASGVPSVQYPSSRGDDVVSLTVQEVPIGIVYRLQL